MMRAPFSKALVSCLALRLTRTTTPCLYSVLKNEHIISAKITFAVFTHLIGIAKHLGYCLIQANIGCFILLGECSENRLLKIGLYDNFGIYQSLIQDSIFI